MTKMELARKLRKRNNKKGATVLEIVALLDSFGEFIKEYLETHPDECVQLGTLGRFKIKHFKESRRTRHVGVQLGEPYVIPEHDEVCFIPSKLKKNLVVKDIEDLVEMEDEDFE